MFFTDTIFDLKKELDNAKYCVNKQQTKDFVISEVSFDKQNESPIENFRRGNYTTISFNRPEIDLNCLKLIVKLKLSHYIASFGADRVLIVGLGNENITADSFGVHVSRKIDVNPAKKTNNKKIYAVSPSVKGITGIDSDVIMRMFNEAVNPDIIILADALMTRNVSHLANLLQISDRPFDFDADGQMPKRNLLKKLSPLLPVIAIGFPTTIRLNSITNKDEDEIIFTSANIDMSINAISETVAQAINEVLSS